jgi:hypothetical protein
MSDDEMNQLIERQGELQEKIDYLDAWDLDARLEMAMDALRCAALREILQSILFPVVKKDVWHYEDFYCKSRISCYWMN